MIHSRGDDHHHTTTTTATFKPVPPAAAKMDPKASGVVAYALCARRRIHSCRQVEQGRTRACARLFFGVSVFLCARARACLVAHDSDELLVEVKALGHLADARPDRLPSARPCETIS